MVCNAPPPPQNVCSHVVGHARKRTRASSHTHTHTPPSTPYNNYDNSFGAFCIYNSDVIVVAAAAPPCRHIGISCPLTPTSPQTYCERQIYRASKQPHVNLNLFDSMKIFLAEWKKILLSVSHFLRRIVCGSCVA